MSFTHLHLHSEYSLLDGACRIADIPRAAREAGHTACAITDHGVMYGAVEFYKACKKEGIKPIIGCEVYLAPGSRFDKNYGSDNDSSHLVLLCKNETGYRNLVFMVSSAFTEGFYSKPRIDMELLSSHSEGLVALSACLGGRIPKLICAGDYSGAEEHALKMKDIFGADNFYLELQNHGIDDQRVVNETLIEMSEKLGIGLVATNDVHYLRKSDSEAQAILMCIQMNTVITDGRPLGFETNEFYYKTTEEMEKLFSRTPDAIENTQRIADMCCFDFEFGNTQIPSYECPEREEPESYLRSLALEGLQQRENYGDIDFKSAARDEYEKRLDFELSVIGKMGYAQYFLVVWDFVSHSKKAGIPVGPGRGSGAGSLVAYLIGITDIDPMRFDLLFERFLNPERVSMPDFDIDFCYNRRDEAIEYVRSKYGSDRTAQIITFGTMAARAAVRDVGRALGMPYSDVDAVARLIPQELKITLDAALENKELRAMYEHNPEAARLIDTAKKLEGMPRHASTHAAGVVITEKPLTEYLPLAVNNGVTVTQYNMDTVAELGLLKFDFLALRYLTIIDAAEKQIRESHRDFRVSALPLDDKKTYELISSGATDGVFQLESAGMRQMLTQLKPEKIDDIIAALALYRPGPMDSIPKYIEARHSGKKPEYSIPALAPILDTTYGCIVYQEQVMQIFRTVAGYSLGHADVVRRAISKKKTNVLLSEREAFCAGAAANGVSAEDAAKLFDDIASFANYAFNKSHAAAYAVISYRTAYLRAHHLTEYSCALLVSVQNNPAKISEYIDDCKHYGIKVLPPDVNRSRTDFHVDGDNIRFGLAALKNIGRAFIEGLIAERESGGSFTDIDDFILRMKRLQMNKRQLEALIKSGALDNMGAKRSQLLAMHERLVERETAANAPAGQLDLFSTGDVKIALPKLVFPEMPEFTAREKLLMEKECSGMYLSGHILDDYSRHTETINTDKAADIIASFDPEAQEEPTRRYREREPVCIAGVVKARVNKSTRGGDAMAFITLEDRSGEIEVIVFPEALKEYTHLLLADTALAVKGTVSSRDEAAKIILQSAQQLIPDSQFKVQKQEHLYVRVPSYDTPVCRRVLAFADIFAGNVPLTICWEDNGKRFKADCHGVKIDDFILHELKEIAGEASVVLK